MRIRSFFQMRQRGPGTNKHRPGVDGLHQIVTVGRGVLDTGQADGAGIVDPGVEAAETLDRGGDRFGHLAFVANIHFHRQRVAAGGLDLFGNLVNASAQFRVGLVALGGDDDVGAVTGETQRHGPADASARPGDDNGFTGQ